MGMNAALGLAIPFVHPTLAALALAAGLIPVVIHLINRRRYREVRWAAMTFLLAARQKSRRRMQLQHYLLMAARILAIVLLGAALARPFLPASAKAAARFARTHHVFLIDNSLSMQASEPDGGTRFEKIRTWALARLAALPQTDSVSLVTLAAPADALIGHEAYDRRILRDHLSDVKQTQRSADFPGAVDLATRILRESTAAAGNRVVHVLSDFRASDWLSDEGGAASAAASALDRLAKALGDSGTRLTLVRATTHASPNNLAVTRLTPVSSLQMSHLPITFVTEVTNFGPTTIRDGVLHITRDGAIVRRDPLGPLGPDERATAIVSLAFAEPGTHMVEATVKQATPDALAVDDVRYLSIDVRDRFQVLLVDGRPGPTRLAGEAGYLATALSSASVSHAAGAPGGSEPATRGEALAIGVKVIALPEFNAESLASYDTMALCNVQQLSAEQWARVERFVSQGGGLLVFAGDLIDAASYNRYGFRDGGGVLPAAVARTPRAIEDADGFTRLQAQGLTHKIVAEFADQVDSGLFLARISRYLPADPVAENAAVAMRYTTGDPALVVKRFGGGKVVYLSTSANMSWNNLAAKGDYVSLVFGITSYLARPRGAHRNVPVGGALLEPLTPAEQSMALRVARRAEPAVTPRVVPGEEGFSLSLDPVETADVYRVDVGPDRRWFAVNVGASESDLKTVEEDALTRLAGGRARVVHVADERSLSPARVRTYELAVPALVLASLLLLAELCMALRFGSQQAPPAGRAAGRGV